MKKKIQIEENIALQKKIGKDEYLASKIIIKNKNNYQGFVLVF